MRFGEGKMALVPTMQNPTVQSRWFSFWERGHLYLALSFILFLLFALNPNVGIYDWRKEVAYFQYMKASFCEFHTFPWFWWSRPAESSWYPALAHTSSFVGNPETMLFSPFTPLLLWLADITAAKTLEATLRNTQAGQEVSV